MLADFKVAALDLLLGVLDLLGKQARLQGLGYTLTGFEVGDAMVAGDGGSATVCVDVQLAYGDGDARAVSAFPLLLRRDAGAWKVTWSSLMGLLEGY